MAATKKCTWWATISFLIGTMIGTGAIWQYQNLQIVQRKQEIEEVLKIAEIRKEVSQKQQKVIELTNQFVNLLKLHRDNPNPSIDRQIIQLKSQLALDKDDFYSLESNLANIEGREPRKIILDFFRPNPPSNLTVYYVRGFCR